MTHNRWFRIALGYLAFSSFLLGAWALFAPMNFYDSFPGAGRAWVSVDGPFNEHLIRDVGALNLALFSLLAYAAVTLSKELIRAAAVACLVWGVPHAVYHMLNTEALETGDNVWEHWRTVVVCFVAGSIANQHGKDYGARQGIGARY